MKADIVFRKHDDVQSPIDPLSIIIKSKGDTNNISHMFSYGVLLNNKLIVKNGTAG